MRVPHATLIVALAALIPASPLQAASSAAARARLERPGAGVAAQDTEVVLRLRAGLIRAEDERNATDPLIHAALDHAMPSIRARAVRALGRIGDPASVPLVSRSLVDRDRSVQREAVFALGEIESPAALSSLMRAIASEDGEQRALAAEALAKIPWSGAEKAQAGGLVVTRVLQPGAEADVAVVARALRSSWRFGPDTPGLVKAIGSSFLRSEPEISEASVYAASRLGDPRLGSMLELAARDDRASVRAMATRGLGRLARGKEPEKERTLDRRAILIRRAFDVDADVRLAGLSALEPFPPAEPVLTQEFLDVTLRSADPSLQRAALSLVGAWRIHLELPAVLRMVQLGPRDIFPEAAAALVRIQGADAIPSLAKAAESPDWRKRAAVAEAIGAEELSKNEDAHALMDRLLEDPDARVVATALDAAISGGRADASLLALAHLGAKDVVVRSVAAAALPKLVGEKLSRDEAAAALRRAWKESALDESKDARLASLEAIAAVLGTDAVADLTSACTDPDWIVRGRARKLLAATGAAAPPVGTASLGRPLSFYAERAREEMSGIPSTLRLETERGIVDILLAKADAPLTVFQITELARRGYFDGLTFHRVVPDFVAQGGCPRGDGTGGPPTALRCEINRLPYDRGAVGMALSGKDTGGSQFFVTLSPQPHLDGGYTVFGHVTPESLPVVDALRRFDAIHHATVLSGAPAVAAAIP